MASSYPSAQSEQTSPVYPYSPQEEGQLPSPNGISAAAILATLSESRPSTSHGENEDDMDDDDDEDDTGGILLMDDEDIANQAHTPLAYYLPPHNEDPAYPMDQSLYIAPDAHFTGLAEHAAALEALTMDPALPTPPLSTTLPSISDILLLNSMNAMHAMHPQEFSPPTYEGHLSLQDNAAFTSITDFMINYTGPNHKKIRPDLDLRKKLAVITKDDLMGEACDFQGIDWTPHATRAYIRKERTARERDRMPPCGQWRDSQTPIRIPKTESFFSFRRMDTLHRAYYPHFQLRNVMTSTSRNEIYYATKEGILRTDALGSEAVTILDLRKRTMNGNPCQITTLAASNNVLIAGGFEGEYALANLSSTDETPFTFGAIRDWFPDTRSYITNHVHLFNSRHSYMPQAVLCSNDSRLRVLDCATNTFQYSFTYSSAVNCSATSPDGRLRVVVGDFQETLITNAETGQPFETLTAHVDDAFACAWADDGIHVATAAQDKAIVVWDARYWKKPVAMLSSELSIPRSLRFSPVGSGPRVLIAAEADDYINIINAQTFESKQVFDFFGPTAGISLTPDGQSLFIANSERRFGGIIELERTGWGESIGPRWLKTERNDWKTDADMNDDYRVACGFNERDRRGLDLGDLVV